MQKFLTVKIGRRLEIFPPDNVAEVRQESKHFRVIPFNLRVAVITPDGYEHIWEMPGTEYSLVVALCGDRKCMQDSVPRQQDCNCLAASGILDIRFVQ